MVTIKYKLINYIENLIQKDEIANILFLVLKHKYFNVYKHCENVCFSSYLLSHKMNLSEEQCIHIALGGMMHDIGKLKIESNILYKPRTLSSKELNIIKKHPSAGVDLLNNSKYFNIVYNSVLYHHERYDGKGYCCGLKGENIPLESRIICVCDSFDAMISYRSYKNTLSFIEAKKELIKNKDTQFDGKVVEEFLSIIDDFYEECSEINTPLYINNILKTDMNNNTEVNWGNILDNIPDIGIIFIDKFDKIKFVNKFAVLVRDKKKEDVVGINFSDFHRKHRKNIIKEKLEKVKRGELYGWERIMKRDNIYLENKYTAIRKENDEYEGLLMITRDVSEQEKMLHILQKSIENLNTLVQANSLLTEVHNLNEILKKSRELFNKIINIDCINIVLDKYNGIENYYVYDDMDGFSKYVRKYIEEDIEQIFCVEDGSFRFVKVKDKTFIIVPLTFKKGEKATIYIQIDNSVVLEEKEEKLIEVMSSYTKNSIQTHLLFKEIQEKAIRDNLTGLYNRQYFQKLISSLNIDLRTCGIIMADVNSLKYINDNFGHIYGDLAIKKTAEVLRKSVRKSDYVFRYGGDEFIALILDCDDNIIKNIIKIIDNNMQKTGKLLNSNIKLTVSVGYSISHYSKNKNIKDIIRIADENMYIQKRKFKNSISNLN